MAAMHGRVFFTGYTYVDISCCVSMGAWNTEKKYDEMIASGEADPDSSFERTMPKRVYHI